MIKRYMFVTAVLSSVLLWMSCHTPQDVINNYNEHFEKVATVTQHILDAGNGSLMLQDFYKVDIEHTLILTAPLGCENYVWKITDVGGKNLREERTGIRLNLYIPETSLHGETLKTDGKSRLYDITLIVKYKGKIYSDTAVLVLYATD